VSVSKQQSRQIARYIVSDMEKSSPMYKNATIIAIGILHYAKKLGVELADDDVPELCQDVMCKIKSI
jgi:hypothetical protein